VVVIRKGPRIICRNNTESWLPIFEIFVEDVYRLGNIDQSATSSLCVVDVGGHIGCFTLAIASRFPNSEIFVYEPSRTTYEILVRNGELNGFSGRMRTFEAAVGSHAGRETFYEAGDVSCGSSLIQIPGGVESIVDVVDFDAVVARAGEHIDILKIDCEGGEYDIVLNSDRVSWRAIDTVLLEYHAVPNHNIEEIETRLGELGLALRWKQVMSSPGIGMAAFARTNF
jgi:FkbM family methyltransferase